MDMEALRDDLPIRMFAAFPWVRSDEKSDVQSTFMTPLAAGLISGILAALCLIPATGLADHFDEIVVRLDQMTKAHFSNRPFLAILPFLKPLQDFLSFWLTRAAVLRGEKLELLSKDELEQRRLMGPWKFNVVQSTFSALPGSAIGLFYGLVHVKPPHFSHTPPYFEAINVGLRPFVLPFVLLLSAWLIGLTVKTSGSDPVALPERRRQLRHRYLYADAALGWAPQALAAMTGFVPNLSIDNTSQDFLFICGLSLYQVLTTFISVPALVYLGRLPISSDGMIELFGTPPITLFGTDSAAGTILGNPRIPWKRYLAAVLIAIPLLTVCLYWVEVGTAFGFTKILQRATAWYQAS